MARNSSERLVASTIWNREDPLFYCTPSAGATQYFRASTNVVLCWILRERYSCMIPCTADSTRVRDTSFCLFPRELCFYHTGESSGFRKKFASINPRIALFLQRVFVQGGLFPRTRAALDIRSGRWTWRGYYRCWPYDRSITTVGSQIRICCAQNNTSR